MCRICCNQKHQQALLKCCFFSSSYWDLKSIEIFDFPSLLLLRLTHFCFAECINHHMETFCDTDKPPCCYIPLPCVLGLLIH